MNLRLLSLFLSLLATLMLAQVSTATEEMTSEISQEMPIDAQAFKETLPDLSQTELFRLIDEDGKAEKYLSSEFGPTNLYVCTAQTYCRNGQRISCRAVGYTCYSEYVTGSHVYCEANGGEKWARTTCY